MVPRFSKYQTLSQSQEMYSKNKNINNEVNNLVHFDNLQIGNLQIILTTSYKCSSFLKGCHAYQNTLEPLKGEIIKAEMEPMNSVDKYANSAIRGEHVVGHLKTETSGKFAKTIF